MANSDASTGFHFDPPERILLGPGPSVVPSRVLAALARPTVGYLDSSYVALMEEVQRMLQTVFQTRAPETFAVTGSGTAAMECALLNVVEPGDPALVCVHGYFGDRMRQILERAGAEVQILGAPWGRPTEADAVRKALREKPAKVVAVVHGETSTGVAQPIPELAEVAHEHGALLVVDTVASLGGVDFRTDEWGVDVSYSGAQKCLSVPPGISPITFGARAMERIRARSRPCSSWYLDATLNLSYWQRPHVYHHTGPINLTYAMYEGLRIIEEQGLDERIRHTSRTAQALWAGLEALGLELLVEPAYRLPTLTTVRTPEGIDEAAVRGRLMNEHGIEIAGGLGELKGKTWRIGLMGASCTRRNVFLLLTALEQVLRDAGHSCPGGAGFTAAAGVLND